MITPTARSNTLPRIANSLNSFSTSFLLYPEVRRRGQRVVGGIPTPGTALGGPLARRGTNFAGLYLKRTQRGFKISTEAKTPRTINTTPQPANNRPTHSNGTRVIASITNPSTSIDPPRFHFRQRSHRCPGFANASNPHAATPTLITSHPMLRRSKLICPLVPSQTTSTPSSRKITSTNNWVSRAGVSMLVAQSQLVIPEEVSLWAFPSTGLSRSEFSW